ncbi:methyltransferase domain-containing protein [Micromonospora sp. NPDC006766]|uniref:methyltransferase domain-containing protein n=1 Tax=Micromonospora sp. NPDC006766 TaxID=3154778 RepID=UPI0033F423BE
MDKAAGTAVGLDYKQRFLAALDVRTNHAAVDVGCGPGTDLGRLADAVGAGGSVIGVDCEPRMLDEARRRHADRKKLYLGPATPVGRLVRTSFDQENRPIEVYQVILPGDRHVLLYEVDAE